MNLENSNFMLTTTTHLILLRYAEHTIVSVLRCMRQKFNKTNNDVWEAIFNIWKTAVSDQGEYLAC